MKYVSNSEIQTFKDCPRKWWLQYYRCLEPSERETTGARSIGTNIHAALAAYYGEGVDPVEKIKEIYNAEFAEIEPDLDGFVDLTAIRQDANLAITMVEGYVDWIAEEGIDIGLEFLSAEQAVEWKLTEKYGLRGKLDLRINHEQHGPMFLDHKTAASIDQLRHLLPLNEQMKFYALLEYLVYGRKTNGVFVNILRKVKRTARAKPPFYERVPVALNDEILRTTWARTMSVLERIVETINKLDEGVSHHSACPPRPDLTCTWRCDFFKVCPMFDDGSNAEGLLAERYVTVDPNARYEDDKGTGNA